MVNTDSSTKTMVDLSVLPKAEAFGGSDAWIRLIETADKSFSAVGLTLHPWNLFAEFRKTVLRKANDGCIVRTMIYYQSNENIRSFINEHED
jgi:hypothetical protein